MTDMRATERLLQVICEAAGELSQEAPQDLRSRVAAIETAAIELQGRGDTLVRHEDLRLVVEAISRQRFSLGEGEAKALSRLDGALGGA
jgi:hypothetical protein